MSWRIHSSLKQRIALSSKVCMISHRFYCRLPKKTKTSCKMRVVDLVRRDGRMLDAVADNPFVSDVDIIEISQGQKMHPVHLIAKFYL